VIEHHESGVNGRDTIAIGDQVRVCVAAESIIGLKQHDIVVTSEKVGAHESGDTAADNGNSHYS